MGADVLFDASTTKSETLLFLFLFIWRSDTLVSHEIRNLASKNATDSGELAKKSCRPTRQQSGQKRSLSFGGGRLFVSVSIQCQQVCCWRSPCRFLPSRFVRLPCRRWKTFNVVSLFVSKRTSCRWTREWLARHVTRSVSVIGRMFALQIESVDGDWSMTCHVTSCGKWTLYSM